MLAGCMRPIRYLLKNKGRPGVVIFYNFAPPPRPRVKCANVFKNIPSNVRECLGREVQRQIDSFIFGQIAISLDSV
jgi:hypothetical protein